MEGRIQRIFLTRSVMLAFLTAVAVAVEAAEPEALELEPLVVREPERRAVNVDAIDSENWQVGVFGGLMSVEDFGSNALVGVRVAYHVTEDLFVEGNYAS